ncbi:MAG: retropepsin-like aspartic protease family protein [Allorhizobium sp.]
MPQTEETPLLIRSLIFGVIAVIAATQVPAILEAVHAPGSSETSETVAPTKGVATPAAAASGTVVLKADAQGHYRASIRINGKPIDGLIDTGASLVAINETTARRLGFGAGQLDFKYKIGTANGQTEGALIQLQRMEIGSIRVSNVDAFVLRDKALSTTLIGMSFLKQLGSYAVKGDQLSLKK